MEAELVAELPTGDGWQYEPKWDGFRGILENESAGLDGVVAKRLDQPYMPGSREAVVKVKEHKTADCVLVGLRWKSRPAAKPPVRGSGPVEGARGNREVPPAKGQIATLLLGLYNAKGNLDYVGSAAVGARRHAEIADRVLPLLEDAPERRVSEPNPRGTGELEESAARPRSPAPTRWRRGGHARNRRTRSCGRGRSGCSR